MTRALAVRLGVCALALSLAGCGDAPPADGLAAPAPPGSRLPGLTARADGAPVLSWVEARGSGHALVYAVLEEGGWSPPTTVAEGDDWFVNWADLPSVVPLTDTLWAAHWLRKQAGGPYAYDIALTLSRDGGRRWREPLRPHQDGTPTEHGFVSLWPAALPDGTIGVGAAWLDGRDNVIDPASNSEDQRTTLRSVRFAADGGRLAPELVDDRVCDCCATSVAVTPQGPVLAYRDRSVGEVRDIRIARRDAQGWIPLGKVADDGWTINGCPVNGPALAARDDRLGLAWYTEAGGRRQVRFASRSGAVPAWSPAVDLPAATPLGRVAVAWLPDGDAAVSWLEDSGNGTATIEVARIGAGAPGPAVAVAVTEASRPAGFPRMLQHGDALLLAWTHWQDGEPTVTVRRLPLSALPRVDSSAS